MQDDQGIEALRDSEITAPGQSLAPGIVGPDPAMLQQKDEHMVRGVAYRERGEYIKAIDEFAEACRLASELTDDYVWQECDDNLEQLLFVLHYFFNPDVDPDAYRFWEGEPLPEATLRELAARTFFPPGYLVVGANYVFASYPLTKEGRADAIENARCMAHEGSRDRTNHPGTILGDISDFHMAVFSYILKPDLICWFEYE